MAERAPAKNDAALFETPKPGFVLVGNDYAAWLRREAREGWRGPAGLFGFSIFVGLATFFGANAGGWLWRLEVSGLAIIIIFAADLFHSFVSQHIAVSRWMPPKGPVTVAVNPYRDELVETTAAGERAYAWIDVKEALRDPAHIFIVLRNAPVIIVPDSAFDSESAKESFARFIDQRAISAQDDARHNADPRAPD